ncbi:MAG: 5-formyltetrahydrofolate cyclo-ligase, partial [Gammaproteobacteria bacterium]
MSAVSDRPKLRMQLRAMRVRLSPSERMACADALAVQLEQLPEFLVDTRVAGYWAVGGELPLHALLPGLRQRGQDYFLPTLAADNVLRFTAWKLGAPLCQNRFGIPEPDAAGVAPVSAAELDVVLLPLLGFDRRGNRLGSGGGWYDRSLEFLRGRAAPARPLLVGIGYHF